MAAPAATSMSHNSGRRWQGTNTLGKPLGRVGGALVELQVLQVPKASQHAQLPSAGGLANAGAAVHLQGSFRW
jgi:hypothetical protein